MVLLFPEWFFLVHFFSSLYFLIGLRTLFLHTPLLYASRQSRSAVDRNVLNRSSKFFGMKESHRPRHESATNQAPAPFFCLVKPMKKHRVFAIFFVLAFHGTNVYRAAASSWDAASIRVWVEELTPQIARCLNDESTFGGRQDRQAAVPESGPYGSSKIFNVRRAVRSSVAGW